jgi:cytosine/adenosine deaminase-related metal-dependent hydrolase
LPGGSNKRDAARYVCRVRNPVEFPGTEIQIGIADRIALLEDGRIIEIGPRDEIKGDPDSRVQQFSNASITAKLAGPAPLASTSSDPLPGTV